MSEGPITGGALLGYSQITNAKDGAEAVKRGRACFDGMPDAVILQLWKGDVTPSFSKDGNELLVMHLEVRED